MRTLGSMLKASVVAGLLAGAIVSGFHALLIEPVIERAIALEEQLSQAHGAAHAEPVVDRPTQRWGLVLGFVLYGAIWGLLLGVLLYLTQGWRPTTWTIVRYGFVLAALPANPDPVEMPADLVCTFRLISFAGLMLFWMILAGMFGWFAHDTSPALAPHGRS